MHPAPRAFRNLLLVIASMLVAAAHAPCPALADVTQPPLADTDTCLDVMAEGIGANAENARKDALRAAVSQAVGMLIVASERVEHHALIESRILTYSDGYIQSYDPIGVPSSSDGLIRVRVRACGAAS